MNYVTLIAIINGIFFGTWPLLMNRSGLGPYISMVLYALVVSAVVASCMFATNRPFTIGPDIRWLMFFAACAVGGVGLFLFGGIIANSAPSELSRQLAIVTAVSVLAAFPYYVWESGAEVNAKQVLGFVLSAAGVYLLISR